MNLANLKIAHAWAKITTDGEGGVELASSCNVEGVAFEPDGAIVVALAMAPDPDHDDIAVSLMGRVIDLVPGWEETFRRRSVTASTREDGAIVIVVVGDDPRMAVIDVGLVVAPREQPKAVFQDWVGDVQLRA